MKKILLSFAVACSFGLAALASDGALPQPSKDQKPMTEWTPVQFGFTPTFPGATLNSNVYGFKFGIPISGGLGRVCGVELSIFSAMTDYVRGWQCGLIYSQSNQIQGFQSSIGSNIAKAGFIGLQATLGYNYSDNYVGIQAGPVNTCAKAAGLQAAVFANVAADVGGLQATLAVNYADKVGGAQAGLYNQASIVDGFQAGLVNVATGGKSFQFGLVNYIRGACIPVLPFVNFKL